MKFPNIINRIILLFLTVTVYGSTDTVIVIISDSTNVLYIDTMYLETNEWETFECNISDFDRDSIKMITFNHHHHGMDTGGFYMKEIALYGADTLCIEDFACYEPDSINGPGGQFVTSDRVWGVTWVWDGSQCHAVIILDAFKYMQCYYFGPGEVGSTLHLTFKPNPKDWSQYNKICFTVRSDMSTGILPKKKHNHSLKMTICQLQPQGLFIALPAQCEAADFFLYTITGRLLRQKSYKRNGPFFWQLPFIPNGAYILAVDDGTNTYSDVFFTIEK